jgi:hypothetical protein
VVRLTSGFLIINLCSIILGVIILICLSPHGIVYGFDMDVKCTVYEHSDDKNGDNVDVRTLVMGLKNNSEYTAEVIPDHGPSTTVTTETDPEGIFWVIAKVLNGEKSLLFKVNVYEGKGTDMHLVASGDDDAPCFSIPPLTTR